MFSRSRSKTDFKPIPIKIRLQTNAGSEVVFTRSMLEIQNKETGELLNLTEEYPLFSYTYPYPVDYLNGAHFSEKMEFFFNKDTFNQVMNAYTNGISMNLQTRKKKDEERLQKKVTDLKNAKEEKLVKEENDRKQNELTTLKTQFETTYDKLIELIRVYEVKVNDAVNAAVPGAVPADLHGVPGAPNNIHNIGDYNTRIIALESNILDANRQLKEAEQAIQDYLKQIKQLGESDYKTDIENRKRELATLTATRDEEQTELNRLQQELFKLYDALLDDVLYDRFGKTGDDRDKSDMLLASTRFKDVYQKYKQMLVSSPSPMLMIGGVQFKGDDQTETQTKNKLIDLNVRMLLTFLFSTKYPFRNSYMSSWDAKINHGPMSQFTSVPGLTVVSGLFRTFASITDEQYSEKYPEFSYLKINGKTYTATDVVWVSDIYNHTDYQRLLKEYNELKQWNELQEERLQQENENKKMYFKQKYRDPKNSKEYIDRTKDVSSPSPSDFTTVITNIRDIRTDDINEIREAYTEREKLVKVIENFEKTHQFSPFTSTQIKNMSRLEYFIFRITYKIHVQNFAKSTASTPAPTSLTFVRQPSVNTLAYNERLVSITQLEALRDALYDLQSRILTILENLDSDAPPFDVIYSNLANLKRSIELITRKYAAISAINSDEDKVLKKIMKMVTDIESVKDNDYLLENYFGSDINFDFLEDSNISSSSKQKYKKYGDFVNLIRQFSNTTRESSNAFLQKTIQEFLDRVGDDFIYMMDPDTLHNSEIQREFTNYLERFHTGVSMVAGQTPAHEILVQLELIEGMVTDRNIREIDCAYRGDKLTDSFIGLTNTQVYGWQLKKSARRRIFSVETKKWTEVSEVKQEAIKQQEALKQQGVKPAVPVEAKPSELDQKKVSDAPKPKNIDDIDDILELLKQQQIGGENGIEGDRNQRRISYKKKTYKKNTRKLYKELKIRAKN